MAAALMHEPETLFLDEPTSGADPLARREFWRRITALSEQGVTVVVTTHFMEEAEYCDRIAIMDAGKVLAQGTPAEIRSRARADQAKAPTMEDAFIAIVEAGPRRRSAAKLQAGRGMTRTSAEQPVLGAPKRTASVRLIRKEARQIVRDPSSIAIGIVLPVVLILLFGYGLSLDVTDAPVAVVLEDPSPAATELAASFQLSHYFDARLMTSMPEAQKLMLARKVDGIVRIRPDFSRRLRLGNAEVQVLVHGVDANHAPDYSELRAGRDRPMAGAAQRARDATLRSGRWWCKADFGSTKPTRAAIFWCPA